MKTTPYTFFANMELKIFFFNPFMEFTQHSFNFVKHLKFRFFFQFGKSHLFMCAHKTTSKSQCIDFDSRGCVYTNGREKMLNSQF